MVPPVIDAPFPPGPCSGNLYRRRRQVDVLPGALGPAPRPVRPTIGTVLYHVLHPMSGCHASAGEAMAARLAGWFGLARFPVGFGLARFPVGFGLEAGYAGWAARLGRPFQFGNPPLQPLNHPLQLQNGGLQLDDDGDESSAVGGAPVDFGFHA